MHGQAATTTPQAGDYLSLVWILVTAFLVLFMQAGFIFVSVGFARARHSGHVALLNLLAFSAGTLAYWLIGFALHYGGAGPGFTGTALAHLGGTERLSHEIGPPGWGLFGWAGFALHHSGPGVMALFLFELMFLQTAVYVPVGAVMERVRVGAFVAIVIVIGGLVYPLFANWCWGGGFLAGLGRSVGLGHGYVDFAGSTVVHGTGGYAGLALAIVIGPRIGKYNREGQPIALPGHNLPMVIAGTIILLFGWMGFNCGSTLSATDLVLPKIAINTLLSVSTSCIASLLYVTRRFGKPDIGIGASGMLAGAVAITASCAYVSPWAAAITGIGSGMLVCFAIEWLEWKGGVDDPASVVAVHGVCGTWGALALGLFADGSYGNGLNGVPGAVRGLFYGDPWQLAAQVAGAAINFAFVFGAVYLAAIGIKRILPWRPGGRDESDGLDTSQCGSLSYPDFSSATLSPIGYRR